MSRQVISAHDLQSASAGVYGQTGGGLAPTAARPVAPDRYMERLLKYIPVEVIGAFLAIDTLLRSASLVGSALHWVAFVVMAVMTPVYLRRIEQVTKGVQLALSTGAFLVWVFALPGPFAVLAADIPSLVPASAVLLILYTFIIPVIEA